MGSGPAADLETGEVASVCGMDGVALMIVGSPESGPVVPRRVEVRLGARGEDVLPDRLAPQASVSILNACAAARAVAGAPGAWFDVSIVGGSHVSGGSAGLVVGLLALAEALGRPLPPFFATGMVADKKGKLVGGLHVVRKAACAARLGPQLGHPSPVRFLCPPLGRAPRVEGAHLLPSADLSEAFRLLEPAAEALLARE